MKLEFQLFEFDSFAQKMQALKEKQHFDYLVTIIGEDFGEEGLGCIYILENTDSHERTSVKTIAKRVGEDHVIPSFEPIGFEDSLNKTFGYAVLECESDGITDYIETEEQVYFYHSEEIELRPDDDENRVSNMMELIGQDYGKDAILRVTLSGNTMFGMIINTRKLKEILHKHVFYADVFDNTNMDLDVSSFENDISLASEFVRLTMADDSLSETERNRMICFGWNALSGNEVSAE